MSYKLLLAASAVAASTFATSAVADYTTVPLQRQTLNLPEGVDLNRDVHLQQHVAKGHADHKAKVMSTAHLKSDSRFHTSAVETAPLIGCISNDVWGKFSLGTPAQDFLLLVDSGSTTLGVAGTPLQATTTTQVVEPEYNPFASSTAKVAPYIGRVSPSVYGDGSNFAGQIVSDVVNIAGNTNGPAIKFIDIVESVNFFRPVDCTTGQNADSEHTFQGIIGFAFPSLADLDIIGTAEGSIGLPTIGAETTDQWFSKYLAANPGTDPVFAHEICDLSGTLYVGGAPTVDATTYTTTVPSQTYWTVSATAVGVEGSNNNATAADLGETLVDSGTSVWVLNGAAYTKVAGAIQANEEFASKFGSSFFDNGNCVNNPYSSIAEANAALPTITASFADANGGEFTLDLDPVTSYLYPQYASTQDGGPYTYQLCPGIANGGTLTNGLSIYGVTFLSQFLTTYKQDGASSTVSFAKTGCPKLVA